MTSGAISLTGRLVAVDGQHQCPAVELERDRGPEAPEPDHHDAVRVPSLLAQPSRCGSSRRPAGTDRAGARGEGKYERERPEPTHEHREDLISRAGSLSSGVIPVGTDGRERRDGLEQDLHEGRLGVSVRPMPTTNTNAMDSRATARARYTITC